MPGLIQILAAGEPSPPSAPSNYMPSVRVEIAFNATYKTAPSLRTWTDISDYVELDREFTITGGRSNERSQADANQLSGLWLDNRDGRFTFGNTSGPYGSGIQLGRPIRLIADPLDGTENVRFLGFIDEWPLEWDGTDATAYAPISASSRISRMGYTAKLKSIIETEMLADSPVAYYTMGEASGATQANDSSGNNAPPLTFAGDPAAAAPTFGSATGPGTDSLTACEFTGGRYLYGGGHTASSSGTLECFFLASAVPPLAVGVATDTSGGTGGLSLVINASGQMVVQTDPFTTLLTGPANICDGSTHHAAVAVTSSSAILYIDGVNVASTGSGVTYASTGNLWAGAASAQVPTFTGVLAHVAKYNTNLSPTRIAAHASAGLTGFVEALDARADRYLSYAGVPTSETNTEASNVTVQHIDTTDKQAIELMRILETTEGGVLYDERDGTTTLHSRGHRYTTSSSFTLDMAQQHVEADYRPTVDRTEILNDVIAKDISSVYSGHKFDATSDDAYGPMTASVETASTDDDAPQNHASWLVSAYKDPRVRVPSLTVDATAQVGKTPNCATVMAATMGTKITVSNHPSQAQASSADYFIEGWTEVYAHESLRITWNLSPSAPWDQVLVIGDATRGVIGTNPVAF